MAQFKYKGLNMSDKEVSSSNDFSRSKLVSKAASFIGSSVGKKNHSQQVPAQQATNSGGASKSASEYNSRLQELEKEVELLTSYAGDAVYRLRYSDMKYDYVSSAISGLLGFSSDEMKNVNFRSLIIETKLVTNGLKTVKNFDELEQTRKNGDVNKWQADYLMRTKDGRQIWVSDISYPWFDEKGNIIGSVGSLRDVTERVQVEQTIIQEYKKVANVDGLTGLYNRSAFFTDLDKELVRIKRTGHEVSLLLVDIDNFKNVNDQYGSDIGDRIICEISKIIISSIRDTDCAGRVGGGEYAVMLTDSSAKGAEFVAERIRREVLHHDFKIGSDSAPIGCSVSIGVASANYLEDKKSSELYKVADTTLYIAKNTGRNQVFSNEVMTTH